MLYHGAWKVLVVKKQRRKLAHYQSALDGEGGSVVILLGTTEKD